MKHIRLFITLLLILIISTSTISAYAENTAVVYAGTPLVSVDNSIVVPICIKNNPGLMGFKFSVKYSNGIIVNSVSKGTVTENGMFTDNLGVNEGSIDILWNCSKKVKNDGSLFFIGLSAVDVSKESISLSYSENDTFNEQFENVKLECQGITLTKPDSEFVVPNDNIKRNAIIDNIAEIVIKKNDSIPDVSKISDNQKEKIEEKFNSEAISVLETVPTEIKKEVLISVYDKTLETIQKTEDNEVTEKHRSTIVEHDSVKSIIIISSGALLVFIFLLIIFMRKKK